MKEIPFAILFASLSVQTFAGVVFNRAPVGGPIVSS
jgi:hypothetical protein